MLSTTISSPLGTLAAFEEGGAIVRLRWGKGAEDSTPLLDAARTQLADYFAGRLKTFNLPVAPQGGDFERAVWAELARIPYGRTLTYGDLAARINSVARAVGGACGANPIPIIIPCHRILAAGGGIGGFSAPGGVETKRRLLELEGIIGPSLPF
ncbi:MAG: methylated-DNA--[protein]-cysteine S-methyltransferase [Alphaproteobacteria bacterium]